MNFNFELLKKEFSKIKNYGWIKSCRSGNDGIGRTFENLLGKEEENFEFPDFCGIEIKTKRAYSNSYTTLFCSTPEGNFFYEIKRLRDTYGYPDKALKNYKVLLNSIYCNEFCKVGLFHYFKLKVDYKNKKVVLCIYDYYKNLLEDAVYWDFDILKEKLERKLSYLAFVNAHRKFIDGKEYFKYYKINFYKLRSFDRFLLLLEKRKIRVTFKISVFKSGKNFGKIHDHGTSFDIKEDDLLLLFKLYK